MNIVLYPDPILTAPCVDIAHFDEYTKHLVEDMTATMLAANGLGLAGPQVNLSLNIFIIKDAKGVVHEFINPTILETSGSKLMDEGCLSVPGIFVPVTRPEFVVIEAATVTGERRKFAAEGIEARAIQHEMEHLKEKFFLMNVSRQIRRAALAQFKKK